MNEKTEITESGGANPSTWEVEAEGSNSQGHCSEFKAHLEYLKTLLKERDNGRE